MAKIPGKGNEAFYFCSNHEDYKVFNVFQGYGYGSEMMNFAESTEGAKIAKVSVASCR